MLFYLCLTCVNSLTEIMSYNWFINMPIRILRWTSCLLIFFQFYNRTQKQNEYKHPFKCLKLFSFASKCGTSLRQRIDFVVVISIFWCLLFFSPKKKRERERERKKPNNDGGGYGYNNDDTSWYTLPNTCIFPPFPFPFLLTTYRPHPCFLKSFIFVVASVRPKNCKPPRAVISPPLLSSI